MKSTPDEEWFDDERGSLVRPYAVTRGRTRTSARGLDLISVIYTMNVPGDPSELEPEHRQILDQCKKPMSLAEISAYLDVPAGVVRVLLDDLLDNSYVAVRPPQTAGRIPNRQMLKAVINGIRAL